MDKLFHFNSPVKSKQGPAAPLDPKVGGEGSNDPWPPKHLSHYSSRAEQPCRKFFHASCLPSYSRTDTLIHWGFPILWKGFCLFYSYDYNSVSF